MLEKMIINSARKAMLENITALDKKTLQRELESHLKLEFKYKDELDQSTNNWNELEEWVMQDVKDEKPDLYFQVLRKIDILDKMNEIKEGNSEKL